MIRLKYKDKETVRMGKGESCLKTFLDWLLLLPGNLSENDSTSAVRHTLNFLEGSSSLTSKIAHGVDGIKMEQAELSLSEIDPTLLSVLAATACSGALLVVFMRYCNRQRMKVKIRKARSRREASLQQAEQAVQQFRTTVRTHLLFFKTTVINHN